MKRTQSNHSPARLSTSRIAIGAFFMFATVHASDSAFAANIQVPSLSANGGSITCSDSIRTHVRTTLSWALARIEDAAETSDVAAERAISQLDLVIARATTLAKSTKYANKPSAQCVLSFLAESCNASKDRIAGGDALNDAVGDALSDATPANPNGTATQSPGGTQGAATGTSGSTGTSGNGNTAGGTQNTGGNTQTNPAPAAISTTFELSKTGAIIGESVPFTYSVSTDRTCEIYVVSSGRKLLTNRPQWSSGSSSYTVIASEVSNGVTVLEMACTNGSRKSRSIAVRNAGSTSAAGSTNTTVSTGNNANNGGGTASTAGPSTTVARPIEWPDQWICTGDGTNQMFCYINKLAASCGSTPPYTPRSGERYKAQMSECRTGIGEGCMCIYNIVSGIGTAHTTINQAMITSETSPMVYLDPVGNGWFVKVIEWTAPAWTNAEGLRALRQQHQEQLETYARDNGITVTGQISRFAKAKACTPGTRETHYNIDSHYESGQSGVLGPSYGKVYLYKYDFQCVGANYLIRWLNEVDINVAARTVSVSNGKIYMQDMALLDSTGISAPQIQFTGGAYKTVNLTGKQCTISYTDGSSSEAAVNNGAIPQKFLTAIDGGKVIQLLCSTTGTEKMAYMSKYNGQYHFVNIVRFQ